MACFLGVLTLSKILYVTTFNRTLYKACAKHLIKSFLAHVEGDLLVCYEEDPAIPDDPRIMPVNIERDPFLLQWLEDNKDIIPIAYGGENKKLKFKIVSIDQFRYRASKWFRKIVALNTSL